MARWLERHQSTLAFWLTLLGFALACGFGIYQSPRLWYLPAICLICFAALIVAIFLRRRSHPLSDEGLYLKGDLGRLILREAVKFRNYPLCRHLAASHGSGVAAAASTARGVVSNLAYLRSLLDVLAGEMHREKIFTRPIFAVHFARVTSVNGLLLALIRSSSAQCFDRLTQAPDVLRRLRAVQIALYRDVVRRMDDLLFTIDTSTSAEQYAGAVRQLLKHELPYVVTPLSAQVGEAEKEARHMVTELEKDWTTVAEQVSAIASCRPVRPNT